MKTLASVLLSALLTTAAFATEAPKAAKPDAAAGEAKYTALCASCHGANFSKPIDGTYPKIAGQHADYLYVALKSYKSENQATWGRNNGIMGGVAKQFSHAELKELAKYLASQPGELQVVPQSRFR